MKTIQAVARYFPEKCGGIHIHLSELLPVLQEYGVDSKIAASQDKPTADQYQYRDVEVYRYPVSPVPKSEPNHGAVPHGGFEHFAQWLRSQDADIYHQHQWTPKCGLPHLRLAKQLGMKTVVSVRLPQPICQRQTLMFEGKTACDGKIDVVRCSRCCGVASSLPDGVIQQLSQMPMPLSVAAGGVLRRLEAAPQPLQAAAEALLQPVSIPAYVAARQYGLQEMARYADRIVVMSQWVFDAIAINGIPPEQLFLLKHGISETFLQQRVSRTREAAAPLRIGFLGRWTPDKGLHILVEAIKRLPADIPLELVVYAIPQNESFRQQVLQRIDGDPRIKLAKELSRAEIPQAIANCDAIAVPSQWLETGPVVVLEAHANGLPVIGSDLGGIAEKVKSGVDGLLIPPQDVEAWAKAFADLALQPNLLATLRAGIRPVRTIRDEAEDSLRLYNSLLTDNPKNPTPLAAVPGRF